MKLYKKSLILVTLFVCSIVQFSCEDNDTGIDFIGFESRFISDININVVNFTNLSNNATSYVWDFGDGTSSSLINPEKVYSEGGTYTVTLTATNENNQSDTFQDEIVINEIFQGGIIVNGDFENGSQPWIQGVDDNAAAPVVTESGNSYYEVNVTTPDPNQPFLVNLSQKLAITQGQTYVLSFDAWSDGERTIVAGIGLSGGDFSNDTKVVSINQTQQQYTLTLSSQNFGAPDARVLFDVNGDAGIVRIDNVSLNLQ